MIWYVLGGLLLVVLGVIFALLILPQFSEVDAVLRIDLVWQEMGAMHRENRDLANRCARVNSRQAAIKRHWRRYHRCRRTTSTPAMKGGAR